MEVAGPKKLHAVLAPSAAKQQMTCLQSVLYADMKSDEESEYAKEGTRAHKLMEDVFKAKIDKDRDAILEKCDDLEMREHISDLYDKVEQIKKKIGLQNILSVKVEQSVKFSDYIFGTLDICILYILQGVKKIYVLDLKYGRGVPVPAEENYQLMTYAIAAGLTFQWDWVEAIIAIYQPRNKEHEAPLDQWKMTSEKKKEWAKRLKKFEYDATLLLGGTKTYSKADILKKHPYVPGDHCKFCPGKPVCKAFAAYASVPALITLDAAEALPAVPKPKLNAEKPNIHGLVADLSDTQLTAVLDKRDLIKEFCEAVEDYVITRFKQGRPLAEWKVVAGRKSRKWQTDKSDSIAQSLMKAGVKDPWNRKLKGITDIEREVKKIDLTPFVEWTNPKPKLVRESDPHAELAEIAATDMLDALPEDTPKTAKKTPQLVQSTLALLAPAATVTKPRKWVNPHA